MHASLHAYIHYIYANGRVSALTGSWCKPFDFSPLLIRKRKVLLSEKGSLMCKSAADNVLASSSLPRSPLHRRPSVSAKKPFQPVKPQTTDYCRQLGQASMNHASRRQSRRLL